jgi:hypothetical protein
MCDESIADIKAYIIHLYNFLYIIYVFEGALYRPCLVPNFVAKWIL